MDVHELVPLSDGSRVLVRPLRRADRERFEDGFARLGPDAGYRRLLGFRNRRSERELAFFAELGDRRNEALGAVDPSSGQGVGVARLRRRADSAAAKVCVVVVDPWQGRGVERALLERLALLARGCGIRRLTVTLPAEDRQLLDLFERLGPVAPRATGATLELAVELEAPAATADPVAPRAPA